MLPGMCGAAAGAACAAGGAEAADAFAFACASATAGWTSFATLSAGSFLAVGFATGAAALCGLACAA